MARDGDHSFYRVVPVSVPAGWGLTFVYWVMLIKRYKAWSMADPKPVCLCNRVQKREKNVTSRVGVLISSMLPPQLLKALFASSRSS